MQPDVLLDDGLDEPWREFLGFVLSSTVENCRWLSAAVQDRERCMNPNFGTMWAKRLANACVAWRWVFGTYKCALSYRELCADLNIDEDYVRDRILAECPNGPDINEVADRLDEILRTRPQRGDKDRSVATIVVEWNCLENVRSQRHRGP